MKKHQIYSFAFVLAAAFCAIFSQNGMAANISGRVWHDQNTNGLQDINEPGIGGVWVEITTDAGMMDGQYTLSDGHYAFTSVTGGSNCALTEGEQEVGKWTVPSFPVVMAG